MKADNEVSTTDASAAKLETNALTAVFAAVLIVLATLMLLKGQR